MFRNRIRRLHFVGVGGIGMSGIAEVLVTLGYDVRGSDAQQSPVTQRLASLGVCVHMGHDASHVADADVVVISSAVGKNNPEVVEAHRLGVPVIRRAEMLAELMRLKYGIAVAGSHGKTTTTSLVATLLGEGGLDPTVVIGGRLKSIKSNARLGEGEYFVAEADESDGSFLRLIPTIAVITNIDPEHLDHWTGGLPEIVDAFVDFANKVPFYGVCVMCLDHPTVQQMLPRVEKRVVTYGFSPQATYVAQDVAYTPTHTSFTVLKEGVVLGRVVLGLIGKHNVLNALASIAVAMEVEVPFEVCASALKHFEGIGRRFEVKGEHKGVMVVDDYGHHPAEIQATLQAARDAHKRRLVVAFQPHRYTRTRDLFEEFATAFNASDVLLITDIYGAGEAPVLGMTSETLAEAVKAHGHHHVRYVGSVSKVAQVLAEELREGDLFLTLGAGNIWQAGEDVVAMLKEQEALRG
jgi:UDP-N-acetylmuramate--alanine ligase